MITIANFSGLSLSQMRKAVQIKEQIASLEEQFDALLVTRNGSKLRAAAAKIMGHGPRKKRYISPEGRARIVAAQKARWARHHAQQAA